MKSHHLLTASLLTTLVLVGCGGEEAVKPQPTPAQVEMKSTLTKPIAEMTTTAPTEQEQRHAALLAQHRVHFAFDSSAIDQEARAIIEAQAGHLKANPKIKVTIEGNCDERGTLKYNLALGKRRAVAIKQMMKSLGVAAPRIKTVSYGKTKPLCSEHMEFCWSQNRRAEMVYH
jgi:peptidoglycan-associated lipoprotein